MDVQTQRIVSLCSGVGGLAEGLQLGLEYFGLESRVGAYVEQESYAASVLLARMVDQAVEPAPISDSIDDIDERFRGCVDWIVAGFPCQPWSSAGKQQGTDDDRWLWPEIANCIRRVGPQGVFLENVPGLISGGGLEYVLSDFAEMGFDAEWGCLEAAQVRASHKRNRVFIMAYRSGERLQWSLSAKARRGDHNPQHGNHLGDSSRSVADSEWSGRSDKPRRRSSQRAAVGRSGSAVGHTKRSRPQGSRLAEPQRRDIAGAPNADGPVFAPGPGDFDGWGRVVDDGSFDFRAPAIKPGLRVLADGVSLVVDATRADQLRCAGNGCVALQAAAAFVELVRRMK